MEAQESKVLLAPLQALYQELAGNSVNPASISKAVVTRLGDKRNERAILRPVVHPNGDLPSGSSATGPRPVRPTSDLPSLTCTDETTRGTSSPSHRRIPSTPSRLILEQPEIVVEAGLLAKIDIWKNRPAELFAQGAFALDLSKPAAGLIKYLLASEEAEIIRDVSFRFVAREFYLCRTQWAQNKKSDFIAWLKTQDQGLATTETSYEVWLDLGRAYDSLVKHYGVGALFALPSDVTKTEYQKLPVKEDNVNRQAFIANLDKRGIRKAADPFHEMLRHTSRTTEAIYSRAPRQSSMHAANISRTGAQFRAVLDNRSEIPGSDAARRR
ncbi:hypothetical protein CMUS01_16207 [Colletotrichum musicola]|uniref:Uncharacterized protein n=1 Tax=Colletotrichum musicola TaxID=2175873 RepID=A0A8H6MK51_9PEZI|nr:hypothetical protein CMUS01_16207 [Colletotrichum musicola]